MLLRVDQPEDIEELFTCVGIPLDEDGNCAYMDQSPQALCGPPIAAIAFAGIAVSSH
jgi:hypothetical protein